jgi:dTDP-glucose 4,6-dehydratase
MTNMGNSLEFIRGKRIFVTGGTGFVGKWITETFGFFNTSMELGAEMVVLSRRPPESLVKGISFVEGDVRDFVFPEGDFDYVLHAAADYRGTPQEQFSVSADGTKRVLEFAEEKKVKRLLFTSSGAVYKADPLDINKAYGEGKRSAEMLCTLSDVPTRVARLWGFVGPCMPLDGPWAVTKFIKEGLAGGPVKVAGGNNVMRSYLYASEMMVAIWGMLLWDSPARYYNVGSSEAISIGALALMVASVCGVKVEATPGDYPDSVYLPPPGPPANIGLREAIERTVYWHREQAK